MATGNIGREGVGVNPLRGQNNVQGSCDMGSFPHEFSGYRHVSDDATRTMFETLWGVALSPEQGLRIPNMLDEAVGGHFLGLYVQGEDIAQSDPDSAHVIAGLKAMECVIVQDLFLNETAKYAHVFLPGSSFLEKDGTFTNAERRINRVRQVMAPLSGKDEWRVTMDLAAALGYPMHYTHPSEIMDEIAQLTPTFKGVSYAKLEAMGSIQWPCNDKAPEGTPTMHIGGFVRGLGKFMLTEYQPTDERANGRFPLLLTTGRILSQYNVGAQTRRTENLAWHSEDVLEIHPFDAEMRGIRSGAGDPPLRCRDARHPLRRSGDGGEPQGRGGASGRGERTHAAGRRLHDVPPRAVRRQRHHDREFRLGDQLPGIQGHRRRRAPHQPSDRMAGTDPRRGSDPEADRGGRMKEAINLLFVIPGPVPGIHTGPSSCVAWIPGTSPGMTKPGKAQST
jgi:hypothetical protein